MLGEVVLCHNPLSVNEINSPRRPLRHECAPQSPVETPIPLPKWQRKMICAAPQRLRLASFDPEPAATAPRNDDRDGNGVHKRATARQEMTIADRAGPMPTWP